MKNLTIAVIFALGLALHVATAANNVYCVTIRGNKDGTTTVTVVEKAQTQNSAGRKRRSTGQSLSDMKEKMKEEKEILEQNFSPEEFFLDADTDCDGYLDSCEWNKFDQATTRDFMMLLDQVNSTDDELLSREEFAQLTIVHQVEMQMMMTYDDIEELIMAEQGGGDGDDDGPKDRKRPDRDGNP